MASEAPKRNARPDDVEMEINMRLYKKTEQQREENIAKAKADGTFKEVFVIHL